jgi:alpha-glucosidase
MVHEFAHNVDFALRRINTEFRDSLIAAFNQAKREGLWGGTYSMTNSEEYFAEGAQAWFNTCRMVVPQKEGNRFTLKTREQLKAYDPRLYRLCASVFPEEHLHGYHFEE